jgi:hypothetical protein
MLAAMAKTKRPMLRKHDRVTLSPIKSVIPAYGGKPFVGRDMVLTVSHLTGTGAQRNPWHVVVTDGTHFWHLEPDDVQRVSDGEESAAHSTMKRRSPQRDLNEWLDRHGYRHAHAKKTDAHPYVTSSRMTHARMIHQEPTGHEVFAAHERDHHITTAGRRSLKASKFALPPSPEEKRRGIKGRLPIDTLARARNALARAAQMKKSGHLSAAQIATVRRKIRAAWPSIEIEPT